MFAELADTLEARGDALGQTRAVVLPDLYVDHLVPLEDRARLADGVDRLIAQGGGNVITGAQQLKLGGNAANTAQALAGLGVPTILIAPTDRIGQALFEDATDGLPAGTDALLPAERPSCTVAIELEAEDANVMLSHPGPLATFGPSDLDEHAWGCIEQADVLAVTNWAQTLDHGTDLLDRVLPRAQAAGAFTFLDTGDPAHRGSDVQALLSVPGPLDALEAWGMNEHEARWFAGRLTNRDPHAIELEEAARALDQRVPARIDVHTAEVAFSVADGQLTEAGTFPVVPRYLTGAGDTWNAGNLAAGLLDLEGAQRLALANAVAALTISQPDQAPIGLDRAARFLAEQ